MLGSTARDRLRGHPVRPRAGRGAARADRRGERRPADCACVRSALADAWSADRLEVLRLFLYAARGGLFALRWELMCPNCRVPKGRSAPSPICHPSSTATPAVSRIRPTSTNGSSCASRSARRSGDERRRLLHRRAAANAARGRPAVPAARARSGSSRSPSTRRRFSCARSARPQRLSHRPRLRPAAAAASQAHLRRRPLGRPRTASRTATASSCPEGAALSLRNQTGGAVLARARGRRVDARMRPPPREVTALHEFRDLFSSEVLAPGRQHAMPHIALVFSDLKGSTRAVRGHRRRGRLQPGRTATSSSSARRSTRLDGTVVKTLGDGVMCAFSQLEDALEAALAMQEQVGRVVRGTGDRSTARAQARACTSGR